MNKAHFAKHLVAAAFASAVLAPAAYAETGLDLSTYSVKLTTSLIAPDGVAFSEASGVTYNWDRNSLMVVGDEATAHEFALDGTSYPGLFRYLGVSTFNDTEGVTYIGNGQYVIAEERFERMWLQTPVYIKTTPGLGEQWGFDGKTTGKSFSLVPNGTSVGNIGLEGISYDPLTGGYFGVKETGPEAVYFMNVDMNHPENGTFMEAFSADKLGLQTLSDISVLSTVNAFKGTDFADNLLILSQSSQKLIEVTRAGDIVSSFDLSNIYTPTGGHVETIEGVTLDNDGNIYLVSELGGTRGSALVVLSRDAVPEPATWAMMIGGFAFTGAAMRRRKLAVRFA